MTGSPAPRIPAGLARSLSAPRALVEEGRAALANPAFAEAAARVLILRLSPWRDVDRSSSHLILFSETRKALPSAFIDFAFLPDRPDRELLDAEGLPWFFGIASLEGPAAFDLVMVSNAFGLELVNLGRLFSTSGIPFRASRRSGEGWPLVILGGSNASACACLVDADGDSPLDGIFFGEGEGSIGPLASILTSCETSNTELLLRAEAEVPGFKALGKAFRAGTAVRPRAPGASPPPLLAPVPLSSPESSTTRLQISAGCPGLCSFCLEGWDRRPYRELPAGEAVEAARELRRSTGAETLELYSFNFNTHEAIADLIFELGRVFRRVNLMSQRLDLLARSPSILKAELAADKRSFTLGIEGISARMRAYYRKGLAGADLARLEELLVVPGIKELKLFYIISGFEDDGDLAEFRAFVEGLAAIRDGRAPGQRILASAGYLVRLPRTPLAFAPLCLDEARLSRVAQAMRLACESGDIEFRLAVHFDEYCADQLLGLGDGRLLGWLEAAPSLGHVYESRLSRGTWASLEAEARRTGLLDGAFLSEKAEGWSPGLPFLEGDGRVLYREYLEARAFIDREACLGGDCSGCGACPDAASVARMTSHRQGEAGPELIDRITRLEAAKRSFKPVLVRVDVPDALSGATRAYLEAWLSRRLLALDPDAAGRLFSCREALFAGSEAFGIGEGFVGATVFSLEGPRADWLEGLAARAGLPVLGGLPFLARLELAIVAEGGEEALLAALREWLAASHVACTESRTAAGRRFDVSPKDLRKGIVLGAETFRDAAPAARRAGQWQDQAAAGGGRPGPAPERGEEAGEPAGVRLRLSLGPKAGLDRLAELHARRNPGLPPAFSIVKILPWEARP